MTAETIQEETGIRLTRDGGLAELTIDRDSRRNSLDNPALEAMIAAVGLLPSLEVSVCVVSHPKGRASSAPVPI